jgi:probable F420-dependent oxidoreductase
VRPFRFACGLFQPTRAELQDAACQAEACGYSVGVIPDHYLPMLAPLLALQCAADATTKLRLATYVIANDYRHPAELAKQFATLDVLSEGRVEIGIGTGYNKAEYDALGLQFDPPGVRVSRLEECLRVLRPLLAGEKVTFEGTHYRLTDYESYPPAVQERVPIMVGAGGKRLLGIAAREADIIGLAPTSAGFANSLASATWAATKQKLDWVREAAGARFAELEINSYSPLAPAQITDDPRAAVREYLDQVLTRLPDVGVTEDDLLESPHMFIGTLNSLLEKFHRLREELGISYFMFHEVEPLAPIVERLAGT